MNGLIQHKAARPRDIATCVREYLKAGDLAGVLSMFHPDCGLAFPEGSPPSFGLAAVRAAFVPLIELRPTLVSEVTGELVVGDTALIQANWRLEGPDGVALNEGSSTEVAKQRADGSWVYYIDCPTGLPAIE